jgi:sphinganine C4-monooxygenase
MATTSPPTDYVPPLPCYELTLRPSLISGVPDVVLQLVTPIIAYWAVSLLFHILDTYDVFPQYRLHTPAEILKRNRVTRYEVFRDVILQQIVQTVFGLFLAHFDPPEMVGREEYDIAVWASRLRRLQHSTIPTLLVLAGIEKKTSLAWSAKLRPSYPNLAGLAAGGDYWAMGFAQWELVTAKFIYWVAIPAVQFVVAVLWVDTWQYFLHRAMHMNKFLYNWLHSRHHRLYVPYAYGALYNHPVEGFLLDILGTGTAYMATGMTVRQGLWFFTCSTIKTVDDHCGYAFPWDPLQHVTSNNAAYHDIHHQIWGIKTNFSQPFFTFWDRFLGTTWKGGDVSSRYVRDRTTAEKKVDAGYAEADVKATERPSDVDVKASAQANESRKQVLESEPDGVQILKDQMREEQAAKQSMRRSGRRKSGFDPKSLSERVAGSLHGRSSAILHADGVH